MQAMKTQLQNAASGFGRARRMARNVAISGVVTMAASPAFAALDISEVTSAMTGAKTDAWSIVNLAIPVIVILAVAGIIYTLIRKV
ncbi:major capsid protein [Pseudomonas sp. Marseille-Q8238]